MAGSHHPKGSMSSIGRRYVIECIPWSIFAILLYASGGISEPVTKDGAPPQPYGTYAEIQGCVASMRASLHGRSILGSRDTAAYIQDQGFLENLGVTEYDVMVGRCRTRFFHRYNRYYGRQP